MCHDLTITELLDCSVLAAFSYSTNHQTTSMTASFFQWLHYISSVQLYKWFDSNNCSINHGKDGLNTYQFYQLITHATGYGLSQWEMMLQCNIISHWLSPYPEWSLAFVLEGQATSIFLTLITVDLMFYKNIFWPFVKMAICHTWHSCVRKVHIPHNVYMHLPWCIQSMLEVTSFPITCAFSDNLLCME